MIKIIKFIFHISVLSLIILSLYPGSLAGYLFYNDFSQQLNLVNNPFGTTLNHFISYLYVSLLGFFIYLKKDIFQKLFYGLFFLAIILEVLQLIVQNRSFQLIDLIANILGVLVAYFSIKIYLLFIKS